MDPVAIVGAGPAGLVLALYLQLHNVPVKIYERDSGQFSRAQGGSLDLHWGTGLTALQETGLLEQAEKLMRSDAAEAMKFTDKTGKIWYDENENIPSAENKVGDQVRGRPEIDRGDLRDLYLNAIKPDIIQYNHHLQSINIISNDRYELIFKNQPSVKCSVLVGADGVSSKIRPLLHDHKPQYSGLTMYDLTILPANLTPELQAYVGGGANMILSDRKGLLAQMNSYGKCKVYPSLSVEEDWLEKNPLPEKGKKEFIASLFEGWDKRNKELIMASEEEEIWPRKIMKVDPNLTWESPLTGITIIGDAAHVMSPFAGEGVNQAMADGLLLGKTLVKTCKLKPRILTPPFPLSLFSVTPPDPDQVKYSSPDPKELHRALRKFEKKMMRRAKPEMKSAAYNMGVAFRDNGAEEFTKLFKYMWVFAIWEMVEDGITGAVAEWWEGE